MTSQPFHPENHGSGAGEIPKELTDKILGLILERIRHSEDFPALAESIGTINRIVSSEWESIASLSNVIINDFALTNKLLKLVNSSAYIQYGGGNISTVSRAVAILGFDGVKSLAFTLILLDHLKNKNDAEHLKNEFLHALFSGTLAREVSQRTFARCAEEAFVCAMFHNLGRLLAMFYLPDEENEIRRRMAQQKIDEQAASEQVLGISPRELGMAVARDWHFPEQIVHSMEKLPDEPVRIPEENRDKLRMLAVFANELCATIAHTSCRGMPGEISAIVERFSGGLPLTEGQLLETVDKTMDDVVEYANIIQLNLQSIPFGRRISQTLIERQPDGGGDYSIQNARGCAAVSDSEEDDMPGEEGGDADTHAILTAGMGDISDALVEENPLNEALHIIMETLFRGLGFRHVLLCTVDVKKNAMTARFGFGPGIEDMVENFRFSLAGKPDLFQAAVNRGVDIVIADSGAPQIRQRIPAWYGKIARAQTFALFPLSIHGTPIALIYADKAHAGAIRFSEAEKRLLRTLRNQAILALKQAL